MLPSQALDMGDAAVMIPIYGGSGQSGILLQKTWGIG